MVTLQKNLQIEWENTCEGAESKKEHMLRGGQREDGWSIWYRECVLEMTLGHHVPFTII